jgi:hypothetical protein
MQNVKRKHLFIFGLGMFGSTVPPAPVPSERFGLYPLPGGVGLPAGGPHAGRVAPLAGFLAGPSLAISLDCMMMRLHLCGGDSFATATTKGFSHGRAPRRKEPPSGSSD